MIVLIIHIKIRYIYYKIENIFSDYFADFFYNFYAYFYEIFF